MLALKYIHELLDYKDGLIIKITLSNLTKRNTYMISVDGFHNKIKWLPVENNESHLGKLNTTNLYHFFPFMAKL